MASRSSKVAQEEVRERRSGAPSISAYIHSEGFGGYLPEIVSKKMQRTNQLVRFRLAVQFVCDSSNFLRVN